MATADRAAGPARFAPFHRGRGLQEQLREKLLNAMFDGSLPAHEPMPSSRRLSEELGLSRNTVVLVYEKLAQEGYLVASSRRGFYINPHVLGERQQASLKTDPQQLFARPDDAPDWDARLAQHPSRLRAIVKPRNWRDYRYPFIYGQVEYDEATAAHWRECARLAASGAHARTWLDDQVAQDDALLVEQITQRILPRRGIHVGPEQLLITIGTQNSLFMLTQLLARPGMPVGLEEPGYVDARNIFALAGCAPRPLAVDGQGLVVDERMAGCAMVFCTPSHQSPTGVTMPLYRRIELLEQARRHDFLVIEDDYESEQNILGRNHPALKSMDESGRVIYLGSLTKSLMPGVRLGFVVADAELIRELRALRRYLYRHPPSNNQRILALFLGMGYFDAHARRLRSALARKWRTISQAVADALPAVTPSGTSGGSALWLRGPAGFDAWELQRAAARRGALIEPGQIHFLAEPAPTGYFRLGYGAIAHDDIVPGVQLLAEAWKDMERA
ncbi:GntR family transcriptional regulator [Bordetella genomosp. 10]|uniref:GntR family transcriptional regulator n=1 Tax=Bordetella genomosp. 10 TaxID=1416804 RepID=A0A261S5Y8_9BORD|nr:PLP-dependent aminotransferase family protein [Bordetella genomosp. 10]OZI32407.1 GntR family transcriptional regulator [Bordetella genomosp. 10]